MTRETSNDWLRALIGPAIWTAIVVLVASAGTRSVGEPLAPQDESSRIAVEQLADRPVVELAARSNLRD